MLARPELFSERRLRVRFRTEPGAATLTLLWTGIVVVCVFGSGLVGCGRGGGDALPEQISCVLMKRKASKRRHFEHFVLHDGIVLSEWTKITRVSRRHSRWAIETKRPSLLCLREWFFVCAASALCAAPSSRSKVVDLMDSTAPANQAA